TTLYHIIIPHFTTTPLTFPTRRSSDLKYNQPLVGDRPYDCGQGDGRQPADGQYRDPDTRYWTRPRTHRSSQQSKPQPLELPGGGDRKSTRLNSSHVKNSYAVFCLNNKI